MAGCGGRLRKRSFDMTPDMTPAGYESPPIESLKDSTALPNPRHSRGFAVSSIMLYLVDPCGQRSSSHWKRNLILLRQRRYQLVALIEKRGIPKNLGGFLRFRKI